VKSNDLELEENTAKGRGGKGQPSPEGKNTFLPALRKGQGPYDLAPEKRDSSKMPEDSSSI